MKLFVINNIGEKPTLQFVPFLKLQHWYLKNIKKLPTEQLMEFNN